MDSHATRTFFTRPSESPPFCGEAEGGTRTWLMNTWKLIPRFAQRRHSWFLSADGVACDAHHHASQ